MGGTATEVQGFLDHRLTPIRTIDQYRAAQTWIDELADAKPGSPEYEVAEILRELIFAYEERHLPALTDQARSEIRSRMDVLGLTDEDLTALLRPTEPISDVLEGKLPMTLRMMRTFHQHLGIPAEMLLR